jgi:hypothetical protein
MPLSRQTAPKTIILTYTHELNHNLTQSILSARLQIFLLTPVQKLYNDIDPSPPHNLASPVSMNCVTSHRPSIRTTHSWPVQLTFHTQNKHLCWRCDPVRTTQSWIPWQVPKGTAAMIDIRPQKRPSRESQIRCVAMTRVDEKDCAWKDFQGLH